MQYVRSDVLDRAVSAGQLRLCADPRGRGCRWLVPGDPELEVEVANVEGQIEAAEMMDHQRGEDQQQDRHENPKQPPK